MRGQCLNAPLTVLLTAQTNLESVHMMSGGRVCAIMAEAAQKYPRMKSQSAAPLARRLGGSSSSSTSSGGGGGGNNGGNKGDEADQLYEATYVHQSETVSNGACGQCDSHRLVPRPAREYEGPRVHYGVIASGDEEIECGITRDAAKEALGTLCFEREVAGLMNKFPCLAIRGIGDYADKHKNTSWLGYAAAAAAACAKELMEIMPPQEVQDMETIKKKQNESKSLLSLYG
jgi:hypothetical protein